ncbi:MAG: hypothetical protein K0Q79_2784 [Flavipsychrobacter sp.]|nr:hypothetical protein [Flavipsychrobacter sp.]
MGDELVHTVLISCQRALLGAISPGIRAIAVEWDSVKNITLNVCYASPPSADEIADMEIVTTEIVADIPFENVNPVNVIVSTKPIDNLQMQGWLVYMRKE